MDGQMDKVSFRAYVQLSWKFLISIIMKLTGSSFVKRILMRKKNYQSILESSQEKHVYPILVLTGSRKGEYLESQSNLATKNALLLYSAFTLLTVFLFAPIICVLLSIFECLSFYITKTPNKSFVDWLKELLCSKNQTEYCSCCFLYDLFIFR